MKISTVVISDFDRFVRLRDFWDCGLKDFVKNPLISGCMLSELWKYSQHFGWQPFILVFLVKEKIIGFAPLRMKSRFGFRHICNLYHDTHPDFIDDKYRRLCLEKIVDFLFNRLHCESADITFEGGSVNQQLFEDICSNKGLFYTSSPMVLSNFDRAIIPVRTSLESFQISLDKKVRKNFRRLINRLADLGSWQIHSSKLDLQAIRKVWEVEKHSWKSSLKGKERANKDYGLAHVLKGIKNNKESTKFFESEVWFLDLDGMPLSYVLVLKYKKRVFFLKTSYDSRFKTVSPGIVLMNDLIERIFKERSAYEIDFITNLPFTKAWKPVIRKRNTVKIVRDPFSSKMRQLIFENQISHRVFMFLDYLKWNKLSP